MAVTHIVHKLMKLVITAPCSPHKESIGLNWYELLDYCVGPPSYLTFMAVTECCISQFTD